MLYFPLREEDQATVQEVPVGDASTQCRAVLCQADSVVCTTDDLHPQVCTHTHALIDEKVKEPSLRLCFLYMLPISQDTQ